MSPDDDRPRGARRAPAGSPAAWLAAATLAAGLALSVPSPGGAAPPEAAVDSPPDAERILRRARAAYDSLTTLRARFHQVVEMRVFDPPRRRTGTGSWHQEKPGLFRMDFDEPEGDLVVSDGRALWLYYPSTHPGQVVRTRLDSAAAGRSREVVDLQGRILERARTAYEASYLGREEVDGHGTHLVELKPRNEDAAYERVRLWIDARRWLVRKLSFTDHSETVRTIVLDELETGVSLPDSLFRFEPPDSVEVFEG